MPQPLDVVVVGCVGVDTNVYLPGREIDFDVEANFTENLDCLGHAGGYASRGYAALGLRTGFIGHVGDDFPGRLVRETFARDGIDVRALFTDAGGTSRSVNIMHADGRRKNFYDGKRHPDPDPATCRAVMAGARLAHFNIPDWARRLLPMARAEGLTLACDLQDVVDMDDPYRRDFIEASDILFLSGANFPDPAPFLARLAAARPGRVAVCGMGARGCAVATGAGVRAYPPVETGEPVVDTNGAGDALAVGFLSAHVLMGLSVEESVLRAQIGARRACSLRSTSEGLVTRDEVERTVRDLKATCVPAGGPSQRRR